jgi:hypothetical protein
MAEFKIIGGVLEKCTCDEGEIVTIPEGVIRLGEECFGDSFWHDKHERLKEVVIPEGVKSIETYAFLRCELLEKVTLPSTLEEIENDTFFYCSSLKEICIPEGVKSIGWRAFGSCKLLEKVTLSSTLERIEDNTFSDCSSLKEICIPEGVKSIGNGAFESCESLEKVILPSSLEKIGGRVTGRYRGAFYGCTKLRDINLASCTNLEIEELAFENCPSLWEGSCFVIDGKLQDYRVIAGEEKLSLTKDVVSVTLATLGDVRELEVYDTTDINAEVSFTGSHGHISQQEEIISVKSTQDDSVILKIFIPNSDEEVQEIYHQLQTNVFHEGKEKNTSKKEPFINVEAYDSLFSIMKKGNNRFYMAMYRLLYPKDLTEENEKMYRDYVRRVAVEGIGYLIEDNKLEEIRSIEPWNLITKNNFETIMQKTTMYYYSRQEIVSYLLDYKKRKLDI